MVENLGIRINELRKKKGYSQEELADKIGVSRQAVSKWELGKALPDIYNVIYMSKLFEVTTDYILLGNNSELEFTLSDVRKKNKKNIRLKGMAVGIIILMLMPVLANLYQLIQFAIFHQSYTNALNYIFEWPLLGILLIGAALLIINGGFFVKEVFFNETKKIIY